MTSQNGKAQRARRASVKAAASREAKGSVQEAIGTLIGDDVARERGAAEKRAGAAIADSDGPT